MKTWLRWLIGIPLALVGLAAVLTLVLLTGYLVSNRTNGKIDSAGEKRSYYLYIPDSYDPSRPTALVITIHGYMQWPRHQMQVSGWNELAEEYGFIAVYPSGTDFPKHWRTTSGDNTTTNPDVVFINDLIDKLASEYNIDPRRIYANGLSNGAGMSFVLSCALPDRIAAVGLVAGAYLLPWDDCQGDRPVPAIIFHGTADPIVPYEGGPSSSFDIPFPNIPGWVDNLAQRNGCMPGEAALQTSGAVSGIQYSVCSGGAEVVFYTIHGGGHAWPGGNPLPEFIAGETNMDIDATQVIWEFFTAHPLPGE